MRAVNLVPPESRQGGLTPGKSGGAVYGLLGGLAVLLLVLSVAAVSKKQRGEAEAQLAQVQQATQQHSQVASQYAGYEAAAKAATERIDTVRELSSARFDWAGTLREISRVVPETTRLDSLDASVQPGSGGGSQVRGALPVPAISVTGCTLNQTTAADLVTRLEAMRRVTNVTLETSAKTGSGSGGGAAAGACDAYNFNLTIFYAPGDAQASTAVGGSAEPSTASTTTTPAGGGN